MSKFPADLEALMPAPAFKGLAPAPAWPFPKVEYLTADQVREAILAATERAAKKIEALRDDHCKGTRMSPDKHDWCEHDDVACEFVIAWNEGAAAIRSGGEGGL